MAKAKSTKNPFLTIPVGDGYKITAAGPFIVVQPTLRGDVRGGGLMLTRDMAADLVKRLVDALLPCEGSITE
jgi:hypothetical protein